MRVSAEEAVVRAVLAEVTRGEVAGLSVEADLVLELGLDSLSRLRVMAGVEKRLGIRFRDDRLAAVRTLREVLELVEEARGAGRGGRGGRVGAGASDGGCGCG